MTSLIPNLVARLDEQLAAVADDPSLPADVRDEVEGSLRGLRELLREIGTHAGNLPDDAIQEIARAYLVGRRDRAGGLGGTTRRALWPRLEGAGFTF